MVGDYFKTDYTRKMDIFSAFSIFLLNYNLSVLYLLDPMRVCEKYVISKNYF